MIGIFEDISNLSMTRILGIESSCDETAAAVVADGEQVLSSVVASQFDVHGKYGGVVPELASREHLRKIVPIVREALERAGVSYAELDAIAATQGPGLIGSLLVGVTYGKALAWSLAKPLIAVNHLEGHIHAVLLQQKIEGDGRGVNFPALALVVSGGHTSLFLVEHAETDRAPVFSYRRIGQTRDDAAGEAYDKVAKLLGLGYPGGPVIDQLAPLGNPQAVRFGRAKMKGNPFDFSFSGIKTAVVRYVRQAGMEKEIESRRAGRAADAKADIRALVSQKTLDLVASFQQAVVEDLVERTLAAAEETNVEALLVSGGVAANSLLRKMFSDECGVRGIPVFFPSTHLSTDNAAMIAAAAYPKFTAGEFASLEMNAEANFPLGR